MVRGDIATFVQDGIERSVYFRYLNEEGHAVVEDCITGTEYIVAEKELNPVE